MTILYFHSEQKQIGITCQFCNLPSARSISALGRVHADALLCPMLKLLMPFSPFTSALFFPLISSNPSSPDTVCADQCCLLFTICKVEPAHHCPLLLPSVSSGAAFHSTAFLPCMALAFRLSRSLSVNGLGTGTTSETVYLSSNSTNPPLLHAIRKCRSVSCLVAFFPSLPWWLLSSDMPLTNNVSSGRRRGYNSPVFGTPSPCWCACSPWAERSQLLVGGTFLLHWPAALHNLSGWPQLLQLGKHPVVQKVAILNEVMVRMTWTDGI